MGRTRECDPRLAARSWVRDVSVGLGQMDSDGMGAGVAGRAPGWLLHTQVEFRPIRLAW